jgi:hypothetical protein
MEKKCEHDNEPIKPFIPNSSSDHGADFGRLCIDGTR